MTTLDVQIAPVYAPLLGSQRYKGAYGGRGSGKSHFFAELLAVRAATERIRAVCIREIQDSIRDSVRQLLVDKISALGLESAFEVLEREIRGRHGSLIVFKGMQSYNAETIKSLEGMDIAWVEEAQTLSERSWRMLDPTIRKDDAQIWCSWNPRFEDDPVDSFFRTQRDRNIVVVRANLSENPFAPSVLREMRDRDYKRDRDVAEHVWGGGYDNVGEASYYGRLIAQADLEGRLAGVEYDPSLPVDTSWDLGVADYTCVWFWQTKGFEVRVLDYWEASGDGADQVVSAALPEHVRDERARYKALAALGRERAYQYGTHWLPHDVRNREWGAGARSRVETVQALGLEGVRRGAAMDPADRIAAVRRLLPSCRFADTPRVRLGLQRLRRYSRKRNEAMKAYSGPLHDENSHGADAFGEFAVNAMLSAPVMVAPKRELPRGAVRLPKPSMPDADRPRPRL